MNEDLRPRLSVFRGHQPEFSQVTGIPDFYGYTCGIGSAKLFTTMKIAQRSCVCSALTYI